MEERLQTLMADEYQTLEPFGNGPTLWDNAARPGGIPTAGWRLLDDGSNWTPCPIGVYFEHQ